MRYLSLILTYALLISCEPEGTRNDIPISYSIQEVLVTDPNCDQDQCFEVRLRYPVFEGDSVPATRANMFANRTITEILGMGDVESTELSNLKKDAEILLDQYSGFKEEFPESNQVWEVEVSMTHFYENDTLFSFGLKSFSYMGGAHPNSNRILFIFSKNDGQIIRGDRLNSSYPALLEIAERKFRETTEMKPGLSYSDAGFDFYENRFRLPANLSYTESGLELHYNKYEVAPYAYGEINFMVPYSELK